MCILWCYALCNPNGYRGDNTAPGSSAAGFLRNVAQLCVGFVALIVTVSTYAKEDACGTCTSFYRENTPPLLRSQPITFEVGDMFCLDQWLEPNLILSGWRRTEARNGFEWHNMSNSRRGLTLKVCQSYITSIKSLCSTPTGIRSNRQRALLEEALNRNVKLKRRSEQLKTERLSLVVENANHST